MSCPCVAWRSLAMEEETCKLMLLNFENCWTTVPHPYPCGSMEPAFHRGDLLFLTNFREDPIRAGEIVVFKVEGRDIPIVHRVIKVHEKDNGDIKFLTKGDNNEIDDRGLYKEGQNWLEKKDVVGRARGFLPYVGMVTIIMNDYPKFKYALLAVMGAYVLLKRES
ncbi:signal peptidase complex catalytic subunit SEC11C isoform X3 [Cricetulus griseus]|uniref:Signal peptidase complex catalytic subunit SEC11 n=1 Tax=Cricetulus griseus TaxID=10029 RepID=A0A9J7FIP4_CRIGR|nr:signal peptidase complex catalytic subunit SEC11C isoform X3 [Cricetulus griseus]